jgi:GDP-6-deoxy-D-talose 4-dehydrogenase
MSEPAMEYMPKIYSGKLPLLFMRSFIHTGPGQAGSFVIPKLVPHFVQYAETVELGNLDMEREFNDMRFVCEAYLQLLEKAVPGDVYNTCSGKSVPDLPGQSTSHHVPVKVNSGFVRNNEIRRLCGNPKKLLCVLGDSPLPALQDNLRRMLSA